MKERIGPHGSIESLQARACPACGEVKDSEGKCPDKSCPRYMTREQKIQAYQAGNFRMPPPPVYSGNWGEDSWVDFIDCNGVWT